MSTTPPPSTGSFFVDWHYGIGDETVGPVDGGTIAERIAAGDIDGGTLVWGEGMADWIPLAETELSVHLAPEPSPARPPALPGQLRAAGYIDPSGLGKTVRVLLIVLTVLQLPYLGSCALEVLYMRELGWDMGMENTPLHPMSIAYIFCGLGSLVWVLLLITVFILFGKWIYRSAKNLPALGNPHQDFKPGWCVGWYFIPFANLVMPYRAMREIHDQSLSPGNPGHETPAILPLWWALWLISNIGANITTRIGWNSENVDTLITLATCNIGLSLIDIVLNLVAYTLVGRITRAQVARAKELGA